MFNIFAEVNSKPVVTIDDNYRNFHLRKSGILYEKDFTTITEASLKFADVKVDGLNSPIIVVHPRGYDYNNKVAAIPAGKGFTLYAWHNFTIKDGIEYYIFDDWQPPETSSHGLKMWNERGELLYHSDWIRLKLLGFHTLEADIAPDMARDLKIDISRYYQHADKLGVMIPYSRKGTFPGSSFNTWPGGGGHTMSYVYETSECFFFRDKNTLQYAVISLGGSGGWWYNGVGWMTPVADSYIFIVDLDGVPLGYNP